MEVDVAVVATPTKTHVDVCREWLGVRLSPIRFCAKSLWRLGIKRSLLDQAAQQGVRLDVFYHYAFAPEVEWMAARWPSDRSAHGPVEHLSAHFDDPKAEIARATETLVSSWEADAGINALSVLARFVRLRGVSSASGGAPEVCHAMVDYDSGTTFTLNHARGSASRVGRNGRKLVYSAPGDLPLPTLRCRRMLAAYLADGDALYDESLTRRLHKALSEGFERNTRHGTA